MAYSQQLKKIWSNFDQIHQQKTQIKAESAKKQKK